MEFIETCINQARRRRRSVVLPEGDDERVQRAASRLHRERIAEPILLGQQAEIATSAERAGVDLDGIRIVDPRSNPRLTDYAKAFAAERPKASVSSAERQLRKPLFHGGMMVSCGDADAMVAGAANPTARIIKAGMLTIGTAPGITTPSSFFLMILPEREWRAARTLIYADCAVNVEPDAEQIADIALASAASAERMLQVTPRVALLSDDALPEGEAPSIGKMRRAAELVRSRQPGLSVAGAQSVDAALGTDDAADSANVLIFPDLNAGNIGYKLTQYLAGASAIGPFLQGFARPISDVSRGASVDDLVTTTAVLLAGA